jgi:hypothetical protein
VPDAMLNLLSTQESSAARPVKRSPKWENHLDLATTEPARAFLSLVELTMGGNSAYSQGTALLL